MIEALWTVEFLSLDKKVLGSGVVIFETGRIFGGDNQYYYLGKYEVSGDKIDGEVEVTHYSGPGFSVFGDLKHFKLKVSGYIGQDRRFMSIGGYLINDPSQGIIFGCKKVAELP